MTKKTKTKEKVYDSNAWTGHDGEEGELGFYPKFGLFLALAAGVFTIFQGIMVASS